MELGYTIVKILQKYSSEKRTHTTHPMSLAEIQLRAAAIYDNNLKHYKEYKASDIPTRKMVQTAMESLIDMELTLLDEEKTILYREYGDKDNPRKTDYWYRNPLRDSDLRFFVDMALYSGILNEAQTKRIVKNIKGLSGENLEQIISYAGNFGSSRYAQSIDVLENVEIISEAIIRKKKIGFTLNIYNLKKGLKTLSECQINPYYIVMGNNSRYYLLGTYDGRDKVYFFRIDLMTNLKVLSKYAEPRNSVTELRRGLNLSKYYNEHPYMFGGEVEDMRLRVDKDIFTQIVDWFGNDITVHEITETDTTIDVTVRAVKDAMHYWLLQYGESVKALDVDEDFAKKMREAAKRIYDNYS